MSDPSAPSAGQVAFADVDHELETTRRLLARVPDGQFDWRPHARSMSLGDLASHIANLLYWQTTIVRDEGFDVGVQPETQTHRATTQAELLTIFDRNAASLRAALSLADDATLARAWTLRRGDEVIFQQARGTILRGMGISHLIHHRGQLSVYLRLLDVPLPPIYGPTADEGQ